MGRIGEFAFPTALSPRRVASRDAAARAMSAARARGDHAAYHEAELAHASHDLEYRLSLVRWAEHPTQSGQPPTRHVFLGHVDDHPSEGKYAAVYHPRCEHCGVALDGVDAQPRMTLTYHDGHPDPDSKLDGHACEACVASVRMPAQRERDAAYARAEAERVAKNIEVYGVADPTETDVLATLRRQAERISALESIIERRPASAKR